MPIKKAGVKKSAPIAAKKVAKKTVAKKVVAKKTAVAIEKQRVLRRKPIKVGVVGLGRAGWNIHVHRVRDDQRFIVSDVCDFQEDRLKEANKEFGCNTFTDFNDFLKNAECELVVIASQSVAHAPQSIAALKSGRDVLVEKPMSITSAEATKMIKAANAAGKKLFVHQNYRYHPDVQYLREVLTSKMLGDVFEIRVRALGFNRRSDWQTLQKFGGGCLNNTCPHFIDTCLLLLESPVKDQFSDLRLTVDAGDADDHVKILLRGENKRVIDLEVSTTCAFPETKWTLLGTNGPLISNGSTSTIKYFDPKKLKPLKVSESPAEGRKYGNDDKIPWQEKVEASVPKKESGDYYDNVWRVLRYGAEQEVKPEEVYNVMRVIEKAHKDNPGL
ncbi:MAG: Gfo/Idh/MocA family oxidoreductase [Abditibacteriaceae bacterium]